jgi:hypothetical protein
MNTWSYNQYSEFRKKQNMIALEYFKSKSYPVSDKYPFILRSRDDWKLNIICDTVADQIERHKIKCENDNVAFPLHKYIHHGLSSQAMLFNLFGVAYMKKDVNFFKEIFNFPEVFITQDVEFKFEHYDRNTFNEGQQQPTSFDFAVLNKSRGKNVFVEAKYVETEFGKCSTIEGGECDGLNPISDPNLCYLTHKGRNYWKLMKDHRLDYPFSQSSICPFVIYYQFFRELLFAIKNNGYYVILIDKRNPAFQKSGKDGERGLIPVLLKQIPEEHRNIIKVIYIQDVVDLLEKHEYKWVKEFRIKYGM